MKIITLYELLGRIKDGNAPKKIKYDGTIYKWYKEGYIRDDLTRIFPNINSHMLNDEVEILEEKKKIPEKINWVDYNNGFTCKDFNREFGNICYVVDEIIDYLDYLKNKGE